MKTITTHYIDGAFVESHGREVMDIIRPLDGQVIGRVTLADEEDTRRAIAVAKRAFATYGRSTKEERAKILRRLHDAVAAHIDDLTDAMVEEYGGTRAPVCGKGASGAAAGAELEQDDGHARARRRGRPDYALERELVLPFRQTRLGGRRRLYR